VYNYASERASRKARKASERAEFFNSDSNPLQGRKHSFKRKNKKMIVIKTKDGGTFWTEKYQEEAGFLKFKTNTKTGKEFENLLNKTEVVSIVEVGEVNMEK